MDLNKLVQVYNVYNGMNLPWNELAVVLIMIICIGT